MTIYSVFSHSVRPLVLLEDLLLGLADEPLSGGICPHGLVIKERRLAGDLRSILVKVLMVLELIGIEPLKFFICYYILFVYSCLTPIQID